MASCEVLQTSVLWLVSAKLCRLPPSTILGEVGIDGKFCHIISKHCGIRTVPDSDPIRTRASDLLFTTVVPSCN